MTEEISEMPEEMDNEILLIGYGKLEKMLLIAYNFTRNSGDCKPWIWMQRKSKIQRKIQLKRWTDTKKDDIEYNKTITYDKINVSHRHGDKNSLDLDLWSLVLKMCCQKKWYLLQFLSLTRLMQSRWNRTAGVEIHLMHLAQTKPALRDTRSATKLSASRLKT